MSITYTVAVALKDQGPFDTFKDALKNLIERMKAEPLPIQLIETACWIERNDGEMRIPLYFYDARDFGYKVGLLSGNGDFNPEAPEPDPDLVASLYEWAFLNDAEAFLENMPPPPVASATPATTA